MTARPLAYRMAPRLVRGVMRVPANDNPMPAGIRLKRVLLRAVLLTAAAAGLHGLFQT